MQLGFEHLLWLEGSPIEVHKSVQQSPLLLHVVLVAPHAQVSAGVDHWPLTWHVELTLAGLPLRHAAVQVPGKKVPLHASHVVSSALKTAGGTPVQLTGVHSPTTGSQPPALLQVMLTSVALAL